LPQLVANVMVGYGAPRLQLSVLESSSACQAVIAVLLGAQQPLGSLQ
jgi:hypothetical protein